jgi:glycosyltransferase involved in cell wall biosynthesis
VQLLGLVPDDELRDWYRAADIFVLPTVELEGFGMVTIEALACGTPVVGTPVGATPELLTRLDPRLLAESSAPPDIAAAIRRTLRMLDDEFRDRCRKYAMERFSWEVVAKQWEDVVMTVCGTTTPSRSR